MKLPCLALFAFALTAGSTALLAADAAPGASTAPVPTVPAPKAPAARISPHETISTHVGGGRGPLVTVYYGRPYSKDPTSGAIRQIWGTLVPWDQPWRLGSDEATTLVIPQSMVIGTTTIPAGAYTLYLVPAQNGPTKLAFSSNIGKWGIPVDAAHDVARVDLTKSTVDTQVDELTLTLTGDAAPATTGTLKIIWEKTQFALAFALKK